MQTALAAALLWLSENPIVPGPALTQQMFERCSGDWDQMWGEWQKRMFLAPDPEVRPFVKETAERLCGVTLTPAEADYFLEQLITIAHGWDWSSRAARSWNGLQRRAAHAEATRER